MKMNDQDRRRRSRYGRIVAAVVVVLAIAFILLEFQEFAHLRIGHFYWR
ncbi:hypothetical protein [Alicyclobacillus mengziensis]|uniref:Uncharacterized protein n=1 Tax=Alicyclobacillus mengziensis TaxID=2931921 RepID=A0A9X7Z6K4_9BACL|nr:hypothetical protein [Alicyclobacillus mengziensis]QSO46456.1 hypothetical protein JZ786_18575 [Alicyclobacillus mengziensis]